MTEKGFAIRCPHCQAWSVWPDVHPDHVALESPQELRRVLHALHTARLKGERDIFSHPKLLRCSSPRSLCPASFEAFVCRTEKTVTAFLEVVQAWSFKRDFRLYKADCATRWDGNYYGILFCTQSIPRLSEIQLESLIDRELLSRLIFGISEEIQAPLTVYAANAFKPKDKEVSFHWMPIEAYSLERRLVPATFNEFCRCCRNIVMKRLIDRFEDKKIGVDNCPIRFGKDGKCAGKEAACKQPVKDWTHCPAFMKQRQEFPCTNSDLKLIWQIEEKWRLGESMEGGVRYKCPAGFMEIGFPIIVHDHVVGVAMTGQFFFDEREIADVRNFVDEWKILEGCEEDLEEAKNVLICKEKEAQKEKKSKFMVTEEEIKEIAVLVSRDVDRVTQMANSRYRDFRGRSESAFREEMLGFIQNHKMEIDFFEQRLMHVLERMREFWAFEAVYLAGYSFKTKDISVIGFSHKYREGKSFGMPGKKEGVADVRDYQMHPCPYLHLTGEAVPRYNPLLQDLLLIFKKATHDSELMIPEGEYYFFLLIPFFEEVYSFVFAVRDEDALSDLQQRAPQRVSELCQDEILETCTQVIYQFGDVWYSKASERAWKEFSALATHRIGNEISSVGMLLDVLAKQIMADSEWAKEWQDRLPIMQKCTKSAKVMLTQQAMLTAEIKPQLKATNLENLVKRATMGVLPTEGSLTFEDSLEEREIRLDADLMEQAFRELTANAVYAAGEELKLTVKVNESDKELCIFFCDNGPGIPAKDADRVFEPRVSSKHSRSGLGLTTVRRIVEAHGGTICVGESDVGAKFIIKIPLRGDKK